MPLWDPDRPPDEVIETPYGYMARYGRYVNTVGTVTPEQQEEIREHLITQVLPTIETDRDKLHATLRQVLESVDARELLMQLAIPYLHIDPNTWRESTSQQLPSHIEYLATQVLGLDQPPELHEPGDIDPRVYGPALSRIDALVRELFDIELDRIRIKTTLDTDASRLSPLECEARSKAITEAVLVRYNVYARHCREITEGLFASLDDLLLRNIGFTIGDALAIYDALGALIYKPLFDRRDRSHAYIDARLKEIKRARRRRAGQDENGDLQRLAAMPPGEARRQLENAGAAWTFYGSRQHTRITVENLSTASGVSQHRCLDFLMLMTAEAGEYDERFHRFPAPTNP